MAGVHTTWVHGLLGCRKFWDLYARIEGVRRRSSGVQHLASNRLLRISGFKEGPSAHVLWDVVFGA